MVSSYTGNEECGTYRPEFGGVKIKPPPKILETVIIHAQKQIDAESVKVSLDISSRQR